jgi:hypothetical protein
VSRLRSMESRAGSASTLAGYARGDCNFDDRERLDDVLPLGFAQA